MQNQENKVETIIVNPLINDSHRSKKYITEISNQIGEEYFKEGKTWKEISLSHNCSISLVQHYVNLYKNKNTFAETKRDLIKKKIIEEYNNENKVSMRVLAEKYHLSLSTVERYIKFHKKDQMRQKKICSIPPEKLGQKTITIAEDYLYNKISYAQMSQKYNCSVGCIQYHVKKYLYAYPELKCDKKRPMN